MGRAADRRHQRQRGRAGAAGNRRVAGHGRRRRRRAAGSACRDQRARLARGWRAAQCRPGPNRAARDRGVHARPRRARNRRGTGRGRAARRLPVAYGPSHRPALSRTMGAWARPRRHGGRPRVVPHRGHRRVRRRRLPGRGVRREGGHHRAPRRAPAAPAPRNRPSGRRARRVAGARRACPARGQRPGRELRLDGVRPAVRGGALLRGPVAGGDRRARHPLAGAPRGGRLPTGARRCGRPAPGAAAAKPARRRRARRLPLGLGCDRGRVLARAGVPAPAHQDCAHKACIAIVIRRRRQDMTTPLAQVGFYEAWWVQILKAIVIFAVGLQLVPVVLLAERKVLGRFQSRYGPNRVGPYGALQPLADILKLLTKEQFRPSTSIGFLFVLAPLISILTAVAAFAIIPFGNVQHIFGARVRLYGIDVSIGPLYVFAFGGIAFYGIMLGGWSSGSKYSFLGAMRAAAQLISYEVSQGLALVGVIFTAQTLSLTGIVHAQGGMWYIVPQFVGFLIFLTASFAETNRAPFDLTEADAELVGGYNTEYGGGRFASYYFAEYLNVLVVSGIVTTVFLGGWLLPFGIHPPGWVDPFVVLFKMGLMTFLFIWVRATLPRLRYDQLMSFGWKILLPLATLNALVTAILVVATH